MNHFTLTKRHFLAGAIGMAGANFLPPLANAADRLYPTDRFRKAIIIDGEGGLLNLEHKPPMVLSEPLVAELKASGMTAWKITAACVDQVPDAWEESVRILSVYQAFADLNPDHLLVARTAADILAAKATGRAALILGTQNSFMLGPDLDRIAILRGLGIRVVQLTYNPRNLLGDGALEPANAGLSRLGRQAIARIEQEKLLLDLSHGGERTTMEAIAAATRPLTISHTGCRALTDHPRNVSDAELRGIADKGGVVGIYFLQYLTGDRAPNRDDLIAHLSHAVDVAGEDHVALGTDGFLQGIKTDEKSRAISRQVMLDRAAQGVAAPGEGPDFVSYVEGYNGPDRILRLADDLTRLGWSSTRIEKILGRNLLRLYTDAWGA